MNTKKRLDNLIKELYDGNILEDKRPFIFLSGLNGLYPETKNGRNLPDKRFLILEEKISAIYEYFNLELKPKETVYKTSKCVKKVKEE